MVAPPRTAARWRYEDVEAWVKELQALIEGEREARVRAGEDLEELLDAAWGDASDGQPGAKRWRGWAGWERAAEARAAGATAEAVRVRRRWRRWPEAFKALAVDHTVMGPAWQLAIRETLIAGLDDEEVAMAIMAHRNTVVRHRRDGLTAMVRWMAARW